MSEPKKALFHKPYIISLIAERLPPSPPLPRYQHNTKLNYV